MSTPEKLPGSSKAPVQYLLLFVATVLALPASLIALFYNYAALALIPQNTLRRHVRKSTRFRSQKIIITGIGTPAGLRLARAFHHTGHDVVGIEEKGSKLLSHARWSNSVSKFYSIRASDGPRGGSPYTQDLLRVAIKEYAKLWIDCSSTTSPRVLAEAKKSLELRTACVCLVADASHVAHFESRSDFLSFSQQLGLPTPETHSVRSRHEIHNVLNDSKGKRYLLSSPNGSSGPAMRTILPRRTLSQTYQDVAQLKLAASTPWKLAEYMDDLPRYMAYGVVVCGQVKAFAGSYLLEMGDHRAVPTTSGLSQAMQRYMQDFAHAVGNTFSSSLTMEFCLDERATHTGVVQQILPVGATLGVHETTLLFSGKKGSVDLTKAYMAALTSTSNGLGSYTGLPYSDSVADVIVPAETDSGVYRLFRDLQALVMAPLLELVKLRVGVLSVVQEFLSFTNHLLCWQEAFYDFGDPLPLFWYVYVSVPLQVVVELLGGIWSQIRLTGRKTAAHVERNGKQIHG